MDSFFSLIIGKISKHSDTIGLISSVISLIQVAVSVIAYFTRLTSTKVAVLWFVGAFVFLVITLIVFFIGYQGKKAVIKKMSQNFYDLLHDYRNTMNEIDDELNKSSGDYSASLTKSIKGLTRQALNDLLSTMCADSGKSMAACVKLVNFPGNGMTVNTFVRNSDVEPERKKLDELEENKNIPIEKNTAFQCFFDQSDLDIFYVADLQKYDQEERKNGRPGYNNTTKDYYENYYKGTAVAPIRIKQSRVSRKKNRTKDTEYNILGYLCVDSKYTNVFVIQKKETYTHLIKAYAALLYQIFSYYQDAMESNKPRNVS